MNSFFLSLNNMDVKVFAYKITVEGMSLSVLKNIPLRVLLTTAEWARKNCIGVNLTKTEVALR